MAAGPAALLLLGLLAGAVPAAAAPDASTQTLTAVSGTNDAFTISLTDASGAKVTHLDAGTYTVVLHDRSTIHNFHLTGPGVDLATSEEQVEDVTWTVALTDGTYRYMCDPHASIMKGSFTVGTVTAPPPATKLKGRVGPGPTISLRRGDGSKVTVLAGVERVSLTVMDRSKTDNFHLAGKGVDRTTGVRFRGRVTWALTLVPGVYTYRSDRHRKLRGTFAVSAAGSPGG